MSLKTIKLTHENAARRYEKRSGNRDGGEAPKWQAHSITIITTDITATPFTALLIQASELLKFNAESIFSPFISLS